MKQKSVKILRLIAAIIISVLGRCLCRYFEIPLIGSQIPVLGIAYFMGPIYGLIVALVSGAISLIFDFNNVYYIAPVAVAALLCGNISKHDHFLNNLYHTVSAICFYGFIEGIILASIVGITLIDHTPMVYSDNIFKLLEVHDYAVGLCFFISELFVVYMDVTWSILILWLVCFLRNPFRKRLERRDT